MHGGHYFALIKPDRETRWLKFDDDRVTPVTDREVLEENYGGEALNGLVTPAQRNQVRSMKRFTNAYMLVYIRESAIDDVLAPFKEEDTPAHLSKSLKSQMTTWLILVVPKSDDWMKSVCKSKLSARRGKNNTSTSLPKLLPMIPSGITRALT